MRARKLDAKVKKNDISMQDIVEEVREVRQALYGKK